MLIAIITTLIANGNISLELVGLGILIGSIIGAFFAIRVEMTQMPQMVAIFNGFGGIASALIASAEYLILMAYYLHLAYQLFPYQFL